MFEPQPAYFCIIQYTPESDRLEGVNVGVVLFCPKLSYLGVQITALYDRAERFFPDIEGEEVQSEAEGLEYRIMHIEAQYMHTLEDLQHFVDTRANQTILTNPRPMSLRQPPEKELLRLFCQLVDERPEALAAHVPAETASAEPHNGAVPIPESPTVAVPANP